jgi:hypothetical protein
VNDVHVYLWRGDAAFALFLEAVQDKHCFGKLNRVDGAVRTANIVFYNLKRDRYRRSP